MHKGSESHPRTRTHGRLDKSCYSERPWTYTCVLRALSARKECQHPATKHCNDNDTVYKFKNREKSCLLQITVTTTGNMCTPVLSWNTVPTAKATQTHRHGTTSLPGHRHRFCGPAGTGCVKPRGQNFCRSRALGQKASPSHDCPTSNVNFTCTGSPGHTRTPASPSAQPALPLAAANNARGCVPTVLLNLAFLLFLFLPLSLRTFHKNVKKRNRFQGAEQQWSTWGACSLHVLP